MSALRNRAMKAIVAPFAFLIPSCTALAGDLPPGFVRLADIAPGIRQDIRYAGSHNFTGRPVKGYESNECWLRREAALGLAKVEEDLERRQWRLVVYDCYRPKRAVANFVAWAQDVKDQVARREFYPDIAKKDLFTQGYIARTSSHSKGIAVDAGAEQGDGTGQAKPLDFGSGFDLFAPSPGPRTRRSHLRLPPTAPRWLPPSPRMALPIMPGNGGTTASLRRRARWRWMCRSGSNLEHGLPVRTCTAALAGRKERPSLKDRS